jgi:DNA-binding transcriptional ArsR family regulator
VEIREGTGLGKSTVARALKILLDDGMVERMDRQKGRHLQMKKPWGLYKQNYPTSRWQYIPVYYLTGTGYQALKK